MSSTIRLVAARSGVRIASKTAGTGFGFGFAAYRAAAAAAAVRQATELSFSRTFTATAGDHEAAKKAATKTKTTAAAGATKKTAVKKTAGKAAVKKKSGTAAKKPAAKKKTKAAAKPKAKKKPKKKAVVRKVLTIEEKQKLAKKKLARTITALRKAALLKGPVQLPTRSWILYVSDNIKGFKGQLGEDGPTVIRNRMAELSESFKALSADEKEQLRLQAKANHEKNAVVYREWLETHTPAAILAANRARRQIARLARDGKTFPLRGALKKDIVDPRLPKRPAPLYAAFIAERWAEGDYGHLSMIDASKQIHSEWKNMTDAEREAFAAKNAAKRAAYEDDLAAALGKVTL